MSEEKPKPCQEQITRYTANNRRRLTNPAGLAPLRSLKIVAPLPWSRARITTRQWPRDAGLSRATTVGVGVS